MSQLAYAVPLGSAGNECIAEPLLAREVYGEWQARFKSKMLALPELRFRDQDQHDPQLAQTTQIRFRLARQEMDSRKDAKSQSRQAWIKSRCSPMLT
jgi:hypothetical protein